jgi:hypothetical protein
MKPEEADDSETLWQLLRPSTYRNIVLATTNILVGKLTVTQGTQRVYRQMMHPQSGTVHVPWTYETDI